MPALREQIQALGKAAGFARIGFARAEALTEEATHLREWLVAGRQGQMQWMADTAAVRIDPRDPRMLEGALSVIVFAAPYAKDQQPFPPPGKIARYAQGRDYHRVLTKALKPIIKELREAGYEARAAVDSKPVFERAWAERAGLGFIGKNACLIVPGLGSHLFLACVVTTAPFEADTPMERRCGECRLCLDACPTEAFVRARHLDARRCISYLTIEHQGEIDQELQPKMGKWLFGCDVCQDVCPYNQGGGAAEVNEAFAADARWQGIDTASFVDMSEAEFEERFTGSPIKRAGRTQMARNARIVLYNAKPKKPLPVV